jgi:hypothetical protein
MGRILEFRRPDRIRRKKEYMAYCAVCIQSTDTVMLSGYSIHGYCDHCKRVSDLALCREMRADEKS